MDILETIKSAVKQLLSNKGRTFLTMLGMFIGVGSVIMIFALGTGFKDFIKGQFVDLGLGVFNINVKEVNDSSLITAEDLELIRELEGIQSVVRADGEEVTITNDRGELFKSSMTGAEPQYTSEIEVLKFRAGRNISAREEEAGSHVILVSDVVGRALFRHKQYEKMVGETIEITVNEMPSTFQIIGVYKTESPDNLSQKELEKYYSLRSLYVPFNTLNRLKGSEEGVTMIAGIVKDEYDADSIATRIGQILNRRHHLKDGYSIQTVAQIIAMVDSVMSVLTLFISALASISLVVGGVGIMNIMLVTVKERTREIGIRKALGASNKVILRQFIIEALMLTLIAGILGMILGYIGAIMIGSLFSIQAKFTIGMILFSTLTSISIGLIFGVYPAYQAARLDPIEALRAE